MDDKEEGGVKFTYIGDPDDNHSGPDKITVKGEEFIKGKTKTVYPKDVIKHLEGHSHFKSGTVNWKKELDGDEDDDVDGISEVEQIDNLTNQQIRTMLEARGKAGELKSNTSRKELIGLLMAAGGLGGPDGTGNAAVPPEPPAGPVD